MVKIRLNPAHHIGNYHARNAESTRRRALRQSIAKDGYVHLIRRLNVLRIYNKTRNPGLTAIFTKDMQYVQRLRRTCLQKKKKIKYARAV